VLEFHRRTRTAHVPSGRAGGTNTLVRCPQFGHSYATSPGSPATPALRRSLLPDRRCPHR
jgi:hypothetical protein